MPDMNFGLEWSSAQWEKVNTAVTEAFAKASVVGAFLPCYGPLPASAEYVRDEQLERKVDPDDPQKKKKKVIVTDDMTVKLFNLRVRVELSREQVSDETLSSALLAFRRAANILARVEDHIVFNGYPIKADYEDLVGMSKGDAEAEKAKKEEAKEVVASAPDSAPGLLLQRKTVSRTTSSGKDPLEVQREKGDQVVSLVAEAIVTLERDSQPGPFACVLGQDLFVAVHTPSEGFLPADRITPLLNGPLLRSGEMRKNAGVMVSLASGSIDVVVATPPKAQFLQVTGDAKYLFRVYERFILRIKDRITPAVVSFEVPPSGGSGGGGQEEQRGKKAETKGPLKGNLRKGKES